MDKVTGKEGKGVEGSGFTGNTGSNNYSELSRSSNAALGIDADVAAGIADAAGAPDSHMQNAGPTGDDEASGNSKFGIQEVASGTVPARRADDVVNAGPTRGDFGVSAKSGGHAMLNPDSVYGDGARRSGTAAIGEPGRGGSMGLAAKGLAGRTGGGTPEGQKVGSDSAAATLKSKENAAKGIKGSMAE